MDERTMKAAGVILVAAALGFMLGLAMAPRHRVEMIWTPTVDAVTVAPPAEGGGIAVFDEGDLVKVWTPADGAVYRLLDRIHQNPRNPERWEVGDNDEADAIP